MVFDKHIVVHFQFQTFAGGFDEFCVAKLSGNGLYALTAFISLFRMIFLLDEQLDITSHSLVDLITSIDEVVGR